MPGTFVFRPIEADLKHDEDFISKMDPYCKFTLGWHSGESSVAKSQGKHPKWNDTIMLERKHDEHSCKLVLKDQDPLKDDLIGETVINLDNVMMSGKLTQWYQLSHHSKDAGKVLIDIEYVPN